MRRDHRKERSEGASRADRARTGAPHAPAGSRGRSSWRSPRSSRRRLSPARAPQEELRGLAAVGHRALRAGPVRRRSRGRLALPRHAARAAPSGCRPRAVIARVELALDDVQAAAGRHAAGSSTPTPSSSRRSSTPPRFARLVAEVRRRAPGAGGQLGLEVGGEPAEAPATVVVITGEEIRPARLRRRRGRPPRPARVRLLPPGGRLATRTSTSAATARSRRTARCSSSTASRTTTSPRARPGSPGSSRSATSTGSRSSTARRRRCTAPTPSPGVVNIITKDPKGLVGEGRRLGRRRARDRRLLGQRLARRDGRRAERGRRLRLVAHGAPVEGRRLRAPRGLPGLGLRPGLLRHRRLPGPPSLNVTDAAGGPGARGQVRAEAAVSRYFDVVRDARGPGRPASS